jgi:methylase of polypeptide subunit release factors
MCKGRLGNKGALIELPADAITAESCDGSTSYAENAGLDEEDEQDIQDVQPTHTSQKSPIILPIRCEVALLTTSNHAGYLSTLNVWLDIHGRTRTGILDKQHTSNENDIPTFDVRAPTEAEIMLRRATLWKAGSLGRFIRRSLAAIHRPVIGVLPCAESLPSGRGKGYMLSVVRLRFRHPANQQELVFTCPEPTKFAAVRQREERFREQRRKRDDQALAEAGMSTDAIATASSTVPVAYLTGYKTFYNLRFHVTRDTLIPRQSTEALLDALHHMLSDNEDTRRGVGVRILDIGTGCGCLLLGALHSLPAAVGVGIDISDAALRVAETNALRLLGPPIHSDANHVSSECSNRRWHFICANMDTLDQPDTLAHLQHNCDVHLPFTHVLCNPPYLTEKRFRQHTSMSAEPQLALVGPDADGLGAYRSLATTLKSDQLLIPGGILILEVGYGLARQVIEKIFDAKPNDVPGCDSTSTWRIVEQRTDQHGLLRCLVFQKC